MPIPLPRYLFGNRPKYVENILWTPVRYISQEFGLPYNTISGIANPLKVLFFHAQNIQNKLFLRGAFSSEINMETAYLDGEPRKHMEEKLVTPLKRIFVLQIDTFPGPLFISIIRFCLRTTSNAVCRICYLCYACTEGGWFILIILK